MRNHSQIEIIVISLRQSAERRAQAALQLNSRGYSWSVQDAVDGATFLQKFPDEYDRIKRLRYFGSDMIPGQLGCFLSHREVWKKCIQTQKFTLVLEDDFQFHQELSEVLPIALENISLFDILRLQGFKNGWKYKVLKDYGQNKLVKHYYDTFGTTAYFVKPASAKILLEKSNRFHAPVDVFFSHDWIHRLNILSIFPYPIKPSGLPSTIACYKKRKNKLSLKKKWLTKIYKIPRSVAKRFYRMKTFPMLFFTKIKQRDEDTSGCISPRSVVE